MEKCFCLNSPQHPPHLFIYQTGKPSGPKIPFSKGPALALDHQGKETPSALCTSTIPSTCWHETSTGNSHGVHITAMAAKWSKTTEGPPSHRTGWARLPVRKEIDGKSKCWWNPAPSSQEGRSCHWQRGQSTPSSTRCRQETGHWGQPIKVIDGK